MSGDRRSTLADGSLLFMENEHYGLVDALPYIDTQLGQVEVSSQVKTLIEEEMRHFEPRDYLASLLAPELPMMGSKEMQAEFARIDAGKPLSAIDLSKYYVEQPSGNDAQDSTAWKKGADCIQLQLEYGRLRLTNLEMLERWGNKAWIAHSLTTRNVEALMMKEATRLREVRDEVNKKRKLDQISCGNELRKLTRELEQYQHDNVEVERAVRQAEADYERLKQAAAERGIVVSTETDKAQDTGDGFAQESEAKRAKV